MNLERVGQILAVLTSTKHGTDLGNFFPSGTSYTVIDDFFSNSDDLPAGLALSIHAAPAPNPPTVSRIARGLHDNVFRFYMLASRLVVI